MEQGQASSVLGQIGIISLPEIKNEDDEDDGSGKDPLPSTKEEEESIMIPSALGFTVKALATSLPPPEPIRIDYKTQTGTNFYYTYIMAVMAASVAEFVTYPLDLIKTRLQIQGEMGITSKNGSKAPYRGMIKTGLGIIKEEGLTKLWQGISPALYRHVIYTGIRFGAYEQIREKVLKRNPDGSFPLWKSAIGGATAGAIGQFIASPTDLAKTQMQMEGKRRLEGKPPRVRGGFDALSKVWAKGGMRGLWKGWGPNVQRAALVNLGDLTTYDTCKHLFLTHTSMEDNHAMHILCSFQAGLIAATLGTPADVVKARVMNQPTDEKGRGLLYKSSIDCLRKSVKNEGFWALYKGFFPNWFRMAPWSLTFWLSYEQIRNTVGASAF